MKKTLFAALLLSSSVAFAGWDGSTFYSNDGNNTADSSLKDNEGRYKAMDITGSKVITTGSDANAIFNEINVGNNASLTFGPNSYHLDTADKDSYINNQTVIALKMGDQSSLSVTHGQLHVTNLTSTGMATISVADGKTLETTTTSLSSGAIQLGKDASMSATNLSFTSGDASIVLGEGGSLTADGTIALRSGTIQLGKGAAITAQKISIASGSSVTLEMGEGSCITTTKETSLNSVTTALTLHTKTAEKAIEDAVKTDGFYTRVLLQSETESFWFSNGYTDAYSNFLHNESITLSDALLDAAGYTNLGILYSQDGRSFVNQAGDAVVMSGKQYALVFDGNDSTYQNGKAPKTMKLVATPEPATATLSLLALAALASRRKRR